MLFLPTMNNTALDVYETSQYNKNELIFEAVKLPGNLGYAWLLEGCFTEPTMIN